MPLNANDVKGSGIERELLDPGVYPARIVEYVELGVQKQEYQGEEKPPMDEIMYTYEFLDEYLKDADGAEQLNKPMFLSEHFAVHNLTAEKAKSTQRYLSLDPTQKFSGDLSKLVGAPCMVAVIKTPIKPGKKQFNNVASISAMRPKDALNARALINPILIFDFYNPDWEVFLKLNDWKQKLIRGALNWKGKEDGPSNSGTNRDISNVSNIEVGETVESLRDVTVSRKDVDDEIPW